MALSRNWNPFAKQQIQFPESLKSQAIELCRKNKDQEGKARMPYESPFERYLDLWMLSLVVGRANKQFSPNVKLDGGFYEGSGLQGDIDKILVILAIAISHEENDIKVINDPSKCIQIANAYAAGGLQIVIENARKSGRTSLENIARFILRPPTGIESIDPFL
jgi:hypothetical protein